jgi:hypothetical protein
MLTQPNATGKRLSDFYRCLAEDARMLANGWEDEPAYFTIIVLEVAAAFSTAADNINKQRIHSFNPPD